MENTDKNVDSPYPSITYSCSTLVNPIDLKLVGSAIAFAINPSPTPSSLKKLLTALFNIVEQAAKATVPPNSLTKFLVPVATAISFLFTAA